MEEKKPCYYNSQLLQQTLNTHFHSGYATIPCQNFKLAPRWHASSLCWHSIAGTSAKSSYKKHPTLIFYDNLLERGNPCCNVEWSAKKVLHVNGHLHLSHPHIALPTLVTTKAQHKLPTVQLQTKSKRSTLFSYDIFHGLLNWSFLLWYVHAGSGH